MLAQTERSAEPSSSSYTRRVSRACRPGISGPDHTRSGLGVREVASSTVRIQAAAAGPETHHRKFRANRSLRDVEPEVNLFLKDV